MCEILPGITKVPLSLKNFGIHSEFFAPTIACFASDLAD